MKHENTLVIADLHQPFTRNDYLDFCRDTQRRFKCRNVVFIGDVVDHHAISYHEHDADGLSPGDELRACLKRLRPWYKAFPKADWCIGNHDELPQRKAMTMGLPSVMVRGLKELYETPRAWRVDFSFKYGNWLAQHGTNSSGDNGAFNSMLHQGISIAQGHVHTASGVRYHANESRLLWSMQIGWGADRRAYAFKYGRDFKRKPIVNCGVVVDGGRLPIVVPMPL